MPLKTKIGLTATAACVAAGIFGASAGSASAAQLTTGLNSPQGTNTVVLPDSATPGAVNAVTQVVTKGPGSLSNITVGF
jgi:hypothetical protein